MITIISDGKEIEKYHKLFQRKLEEFFTEKIDCWVGYHGGSVHDTVLYSPLLNLWIISQELETSYWNGFGIGRPKEGKNHSMTGQINFPYKNINRRIAGAFAIEDNENILVLHRGKIGGGKPGVGKNLFTENFRGDKVIAIDGDRESELYLVGELGSQLLTKQVANFISEIKRIKDFDNLEENINFEELNNYQYTAENSGKSIVDRQGRTTINRIHGIVVSALVKELERKGRKIGNNGNLDLFIHYKNKITTLFEIKTSSSTQNIYSAVGQLLIYSIPIKNEVKLVAVLPDKLNKTVENRFEGLGIKILYYKWETNEPKFIKIDELLAD